MKWDNKQRAEELRRRFRVEKLQRDFLDDERRELGDIGDPPPVTLLAIVALGLLLLVMVIFGAIELRGADLVRVYSFDPSTGKMIESYMPYVVPAPPTPTPSGVVWPSPGAVDGVPVTDGNRQAIWSGVLTRGILENLPNRVSLLEGKVAGLGSGGGSGGISYQFAPPLALFVSGGSNVVRLQDCIPIDGLEFYLGWSNGKWECKGIAGLGTGGNAPAPVAGAIHLIAPAEGVQLTTMPDGSTLATTGSPISPSPGAPGAQAGCRVGEMRVDGEAVYICLQGARWGRIGAEIGGW